MNAKIFISIVSVDRDYKDSTFQTRKVVVAHNDNRWIQQGCYLPLVLQYELQRRNQPQKSLCQTIKPKINTASLGIVAICLWTWTSDYVHIPPQGTGYWVDWTVAQ
jgi:hypothetical protein